MWVYSTLGLGLRVIDLRIFEGFSGSLIVGFRLVRLSKVQRRALVGGFTVFRRFLGVCWGLGFRGFKSHRGFKAFKIWWEGY